MKQYQEVFLYSKYVKPHKDLTEQISLLVERKLVISDPQAAEKSLRDLNYYRFSGFARQFQIEPADNRNDFYPGTDFFDICSLMEADDKFRLMLGTALKQIELSVRARFAHIAGDICGNEAFYLQPERYTSAMRDVDKFVDNVANDLNRSNSRMIRRYKVEDSLERVPIWVAVEVMSFGSVAKIINYLEDKTPAQKVADSYSVPWSGFQSSLHSLSVLRNMCAHHSQLWHRKLEIQCPTHRKHRPRGVRFDPHGIFPALIAMKGFMKSITGDNSWYEGATEFLQENTEYADGIYNPFIR